MQRARLLWIATPFLLALGGCQNFEACELAGDEDEDGLADCADPECGSSLNCQAENCTNTVDDNGNGLVDCNDPGCAADPACVAELCDNKLDDDGDLTIDCVDEDCALDPLCQELDLCAAPAEAPDPSTQSADITGLPNRSDGSCFSLGGGSDVIFQITTAQSGVLELSLDSDSDLGLFVQSACGDETTELSCRDTGAAGATEELALQVSAGETLFVFVSGFSATEAGSFTLSLASRAVDHAALCSSEATTLIGNVVDASGDTAADAQAVTDFSGSCIGDSATGARLFTFLPPASGDLLLTLDSATNQGLYVRADCADRAELGCAERAGAGQLEVLSVPVTVNQAITIIVESFAPGQEGPFTLTGAIQ